MDLHQLSHNMFQLRLGDDVFLTIATSLKDEVLSGHLPNADKESCGWIVRDNDVFLWKHRLMCIDDTVHIIGSYLNGITLFDLVREKTLSLGHVSRLARALQTLERKSVVFSSIHTQAIVFLVDGSVLLLANETAQLLCKYQGHRENAQACYPFNHPMSEKYDYSNEERYSFALAALTYYALCGKRPWEVDHPDELKQHIMSGILPTLHFYDPHVRPDIVHELHTILSQPKLPPPPLKFWDNFFHACLTHGTHTYLSDHEVKVRSHRAHAMFHRLYKLRARRAQLRIRSLRLFGGLLFMLVLIVAPYGLIKLIANRPAYNSLSAEQVVERYYQGIDSLDKAQIMETLHPAYFPPSVERVETIYRASRVGMIFRFQNPYLDPDLWVESGRPRIGARYSIYGIDMLSLNEAAHGASGSASESGSANESEIIVQYRQWIPRRFADGEAINERANSAVAMRQERVSLQMQNGRWVITAIEPLTAIEPSAAIEPSEATEPSAATEPRDATEL